MDASGGMRRVQQQSVKRIWQGGVAGKAYRLPGIADDVQPRMILAPERPSHGIRRQTAGGRDDQRILPDVEEGRGIIRDHTPEGIQQPLIALLRRQGGRQVQGDGDEAVGFLHSG